MVFENKDYSFEEKTIGRIIVSYFYEFGIKSSAISKEILTGKPYTWFCGFVERLCDQNGNLFMDEYQRVREEDRLEKTLREMETRQPSSSQDQRRSDFLVRLSNSPYY